MTRARTTADFVRAIVFLAKLLIVAVLVSLIDSVTGREQRHRNAARDEREQESTVDLSADDYTVTADATAATAHASTASNSVVSSVPTTPHAHQTGSRFESVDIGRPGRDHLRAAARRQSDRQGKRR